MAIRGKPVGVTNSLNGNKLKMGVTTDFRCSYERLDVGDYTVLVLLDLCVLVTNCIKLNVISEN